MFFLLRMTIYNLTAAPSLMPADLHTVPPSSAVLYGQGASLRGCWAWQQREDSGNNAGKSQLRDPQHTPRTHCLNGDDLKVIEASKV